MAAASDLPTFRAWLSVDQLQMPEEQLSWKMAELSLYQASVPPKMKASPWISSMDIPLSAFGNAGPNVRKLRSQNEKAMPFLLDK